MPIYKAPVDDALFLLNDVFHRDHYGNLPGFSDASPDVVEAVLREAAKFSEEVLTPLNRVGDKEGCKRGADGSVTTPKGSRKLTRRSLKAAGSGFRPLRNSGGRACRRHLPNSSTNSFAPPIWLSRHTWARSAPFQRCWLMPPTR